MDDAWRPLRRRGEFCIMARLLNGYNAVMYDLLIRESLAPARVRGALDRLLATGDPLRLVDEDGLRRFVRLVESSRFAVDILRVHDEAWEILSTGAYSDDLRRPLQDAAAVRRHLALSLFHVLCIDILELAPFTETLAILSQTADECIGAAVEIAWRELAERYGEPEGLASGERGYAVLAMGKLGGGELNFSSDIDLIPLYARDGETMGGSRGSLSHVEWYARLTEKFVDILAGKTHGALAYKVDLRLRPEGKAGPLVRSLDAMLNYYEREGSTWERQALVKVRGAAGDPALAAAFTAGVQPFVYRRFMDRDAVYQVEAIKRKIEDQARYGSRNVKLARGGIREIEFIVQLLQLANGGRCEAVRSPSTLAALDLLVENRYLLESERDRLRAAYLFLRRIEHRLQMMDGRQTHILPEDDLDVADLARRLGFASADEFGSAYHETTAVVRGFYEQRFARSREVSVTAVEIEVIALLEDPDQESFGAPAASASSAPASSAPASAAVADDAERDAEFRKASAVAGGANVEGVPVIGVSGPTLSARISAESVDELRRLSRGSIADPQTATMRRLFIHSTPSWLPALLDLPDPDRGLKHFARLIESYGAKSSIFEILASYPAVALLLVRIASLSDPLTDLISRDPSTLEALLSPGGVTGGRDRAALDAHLADLMRFAPSRDRALLIIRAEEHLRIGVRFLMGLADAHRTGRELATLAELLLGDASFVVVALGRFGAGDLGLTSDLDLVFVADQDIEEATRVVEARTKSWTKLGCKIDARLRPMGRTSPLVCEAEALDAYFHGAAETWERVAWARARVVAGPPALAARVAETIRDFQFSRPFDRQEVEEMTAMRKRLRDAAPSGDLKRGDGGLIDIDLLTAMRRLSTHGDSVDPPVVLADHRELVAAYRFLKTLDAAAQFSFARSWRGTESATDRERVAFLLTCHGLDLADLPAHRAVIAAAWEEETKS